MAKWGLLTLLVALGGVVALPAMACGEPGEASLTIAQKGSWQDRLAGRALILSERQVLGGETVTARRSLSLCPDGTVVLQEARSTAARADGSQSQSQQQLTRTGRWRVEGDTLIVDFEGETERHALSMRNGDVAIDGRVAEFGATDCR